MASDSLSKAGALSRDKLVVFIPTDADETWIAKIKARYPGLDIRWARSRSSKDGEQILTSTYPPELWEGVTIMCSDWMPPPEHLLTSVRYCQITSAGTDKWKGHATYEDGDVVFCNASGVHP